MTTPMIELYPVWLRLWHWFNALMFLVLVVSGAALHFTEAFGWMMDFDTARLLHNVCGVLLSIAYAVYTVGNILSGNWRFYRPEFKGLIPRTLMQVRHYALGIFHGDPQPFPATARSKFNPLQQLAYLGVMGGLMPALIITGLMYLFPELAPEQIMDMGGIWPLAILHQLAGLFGAAFLIGHVYLATAGRTVTSDFRKMILGRKTPKDS